MCVQPIKSVRVLHVRPPTRAAHDRRNATRPHICLLGDCPTHYHPTQTQQPQGHRQNNNLLLIKWQHLDSSAMCPTAHSLSLPAPWSTLTVCPHASSSESSRLVVFLVAHEALPLILVLEIEDDDF